MYFENIIGQDFAKKYLTNSKGQIIKAQLKQTNTICILPFNFILYIRVSACIYA